MKHGANIYKYAKAANCAPHELIDFSSNINCYRQEPTLPLSHALVSKYADSSYRALKKVIAKNYALKSSQIALYNGATAAIFSLLETLKQKKVFLYAPLYGEYQKACEGKKDLYIIDRIHNIDEEPLEKSIVVFVNPSTPEGTHYDLEELFATWMRQKCTIIIDESFLEFKNLPSFREKINSYKKLYIVHSFTKFYACAGVRIGAIFSSKKNITKLQTPLWNLSSLDVAFLQERLEDTQFKEKSRALHRAQKEELLSILEHSELFEEVVESSTNFILVRAKNAEELFTYLLQNRLLVRQCGSFDFLTDAWLRFAVKGVQEQKRLKELLENFSL